MEILNCYKVIIVEEEGEDGLFEFIIFVLENEGDE